jgi:hypothetical protein
LRFFDCLTPFGLVDPCQILTAYLAKIIESAYELRLALVTFDTGKIAAIGLKRFARDVGAVAHVRSPLGPDLILLTKVDEPVAVAPPLPPGRVREERIVA